MRHSNILFVSVLILSLAFGTISCTGYADGPAISLAAASKKIVAVWKVKEAAVNNSDITANYEGDTFTFQEGGSFKYRDAARTIVLPPFTQNAEVAVDGNGSWEFVNDISTLELFYTNRITDPYNSNITYDENVNEIWEITRLTKTELWMRKDGLFLKMIPQ